MGRISSLAAWAALLPTWGTALSVAQEPEPDTQEPMDEIKETRTEAPMMVPVCSSAFFAYAAYPARDPDACVQYCIPRGQCEMNLLVSNRMVLFVSEPGDCRLKEFLYLAEPDLEDKFIQKVIATNAPLCAKLTVTKYRKTPPPTTTPKPEEPKSAPPLGYKGRFPRRGPYTTYPRAQPQKVQKVTNETTVPQKPKVPVRQQPRPKKELEVPVGQQPRPKEELKVPVGQQPRPKEELKVPVRQQPRPKEELKVPKVTTQTKVPQQPKVPWSIPQQALRKLPEVPKEDPIQHQAPETTPEAHMIPAAPANQEPPEDQTLNSDRRKLWVPPQPKPRRDPSWPSQE